MTKSELINMLIEYGQKYTSEAIESVKRNRHMNDLGNDDLISQDIVNALIVDFINFIGIKNGIDVGMYVKDLKL